MEITKLSLKERLAIARSMATVAGERDGHYDVQTYQDSRSMLIITVQTVTERLSRIDDKIRTEEDEEKYEDLQVDELLESVYLRAYVKAWGEARKNKK